MGWELCSRRFWAGVVGLCSFSWVVLDCVGRVGVLAFGGLDELLLGWAVVWVFCLCMCGYVAEKEECGWPDLCGGGRRGGGRR